MLALLMCLLSGSAMHANSAHADSVDGVSIDLASDTAWTLRCDDGPVRAIKVPGGGWNSDQQSPRIQEMREVKDYVLYERKITIPARYSEQAVRLRFGAVTHGCEVFLDDKKVGEHHSPQVAFEMDLTAQAKPGSEQVLQVKAFHRRHYFKPGDNKTAEIAVGWDYPAGDDAATRAEAKRWSRWMGQSKVGYGILRSIDLAVLPAVHVGEVFVRPSVSRRELVCDVWLRNTTGKARTVALDASLSSWNKSDWRYPDIPAATATIPAHATVKVRLGPVSWTPGSESYWWPNIPFREGYRAQLHCLNFTVAEAGAPCHTTSTRFGFVEHGEGPHYYTVNGVRVTGLSDGAAEGGLSHYDAYGSSVAFLGAGCRESWRRYMRIGINMNRLHCSPPTKAMMDAADEVGFMLIPEAPIWGNSLSRYSATYTPQSYYDLGRHCRNHPCVARYSLTNEVREPREKMEAKWPWRAAIDDIRTVDDGRPLTFEMHKQGTGRVEGRKGGHAWIMEHYANIHEKVGPGKGIRGMGEHFWSRNSMGEFAVGVRTLRVNDWCYMAGWCWINYWPNFLEGMSHAQHAWKPQNHADRKDGIDGWGSPIVEFTQRSLHPYLVQDLGILKNNPGDPKDLGDGKIAWPYALPRSYAGQQVERQVAVFNGGLAGNTFTLRWLAHWDSPTGPEAIKGGDIPCTIEPGFHATQSIVFTVPKIEQDTRKLYLVMESIMDGKPVFRSDETAMTIVNRLVAPSAVYLRADRQTQGDWEGKYGSDGYELVGHESKLPASVGFAWKSGKEWVYDKATDDKRALAYFVNPPTGKDRIAAARYGSDVAFVIDAGLTPRCLTLYSIDYDKKGRTQSIELYDAQTGKQLDRQELTAFTEGCYQRWTIQGAVKVVVHRLAGVNANLSGIFLDAAE